MGRIDPSKLEKIVNAPDANLRMVFQAEGDGQEPGSAQLPDPFDADYVLGDGEKRVVRPPMSPSVWLRCLRRSTRLRRLLKLNATNSVGLGWKIVAKDKRDEEDGVLDPQTQDEVAEYTDWFEDCNPDEPVTDVASKAVLDKCGQGTGYYEVVPEWRTNRPRALHHMPGEFVRIREDGDGYVQALMLTGAGAFTSGGPIDRRWYKRFNDARVMDRFTGDFGSPSTVARAAYATELIARRNHDPEQGWYGLPDWFAARDSMNASGKAFARLATAIERSPGWSLAVAIENAGLDPTEYAGIKDSLKNTQDALKTVGRPIFLNPKKLQSARNADMRTKFQSLGSGLPETDNILAVIKHMEEAVREAAGPSSLFLGSTADLSRAAAGVARTITVEQEWMPLLRSEEWAMNRIMRRLGAKKTRFEFTRPETADNYQKTQMASRLKLPELLSLNALTRLANDLMGTKIPIHAGKKWAEVPIFMLKAVLAAGGKSILDNDTVAAFDGVLDVADLFMDAQR